MGQEEERRTIIQDEKKENEIEEIYTILYNGCSSGPLYVDK